MVRLIRACSYSDYQISMTIRNATDFFRCWTGFPTRYFSISDSKNRAAAVWKTALTGAWGSTSTSRKPSVPWKRNGWFFAFVYTDALLAIMTYEKIDSQIAITSWALSVLEGNQSDLGWPWARKVGIASRSLLSRSADGYAAKMVSISASNASSGVL